MLALQKGFTVPQIFFNDKHIGGAMETVMLLEQWDEEEGNDEDGTYGAHKRYLREVDAFPEPTDPRLATPPDAGLEETPAWKLEPPRGEDDLLQLPGGPLSVLQVTSILETALMNDGKVKHRGCVHRHVVPKSKLVGPITSQFRVQQEGGGVQPSESKAGGIGDLRKVCVTKEGLALSGYDPTSYFDEDAITRGPLPGKADLTAEHATATYQFATPERQERFLASPDKFAPAFGGFCAKAVSENDVYWINPKTFLIQDGNLLMFYDKDSINTKDFWLDDKRPWDDGTHKDGSDSATRLAAAEKYWQAGPIPVQQEGGGVQPSESKAGTIESNHEEVLTLLLKRTILHEIVTIKNEPYFRLQVHHTPHILNSFRVWTDRVDPDGLAIVRRLTDQLNTITSRHDTSSGDTNLKEAREDVDYNKLLEATCELQKVDMGAMSVNVRTAFVINIYNLFIRLAQIHVGVGNNLYQRNYYFQEVSMEIGGQIFGFHDLESGILRGNRNAPYALSKPFAKKDARLGLALENPDCRIHFGLNCGAASCPPVKEFTADNLEEELRIVALAFCGQDEGVELLPKESGKGGEVRFTTIMNWYLDDFGGCKQNLPFFIMKFLTGEKQMTLARMLGVDVNIAESDDMQKSSVKINFTTYDWAPHGVSDVKTFVRSDLKADYVSVKAILS